MLPWLNWNTCCSFSFSTFGFLLMLVDANGSLDKWLVILQDNSNALT